MALSEVHLRKLLSLLFLPDNLQTSALRDDIRETIRKEAGVKSDGGGDFHSPFWKDARDHAFNRKDLADLVSSRIERNHRRARLYPELRKGFESWWNDKRRWTNEPFREIESPFGRIEFAGLGTVIVRGLLAVRDANNVDHFVYPYFSENPKMTEASARLGLWALTKALPRLDQNELRILDVLRGEPFSLDRIALQGNEEQVLRDRYMRLVDRWNHLRKDYD